MAAPLLAGLSLQTLYMIADMVFVGMVSAEAMTALSFIVPLAVLGLGLTFGLGAGITTVIARHVGARDKRRADCAAQHAVLLGLVMAAVFTACGWLWGRQVLLWLGVPADLLHYAWSYLRILAGGYVLVVMSLFFRAILTGEGNVRTPLLVLGAGTVVNTVLDPILIFHFGLGVAGAAASTVVAQAISCSIFVYMLFFQDHAYVTFSWRDFELSPDILRDIVRIGTPASVSFVVMAIGGGLFNRLLVGHSPDAVAAYQVGTRLDHLAQLPLIAISASLVTLVGMFSGAGRVDLVRRVIAYALTTASIIAAAMAGIFWIFAPGLVSIFSDSAAIHGIATVYLRVVAISYPMVAFSLPAGRALQGMGQGLPVLVISVLRVFLVGLPLAWLFLYRLDRGVVWVWISMVVGAFVSALVGAIWLWRAVRHLPAAGVTAPVSSPTPTA
jgi:putative MATE family efflux protein